jgi:hypothetical protein
MKFGLLVIVVISCLSSRVEAILLNGTAATGCGDGRRDAAEKCDDGLSVYLCIYMYIIFVKKRVTERIKLVSRQH